MRRKPFPSTKLESAFRAELGEKDFFLSTINENSVTKFPYSLSESHLTGREWGGG